MNYDVNYAILHRLVIQPIADEAFVRQFPDNKQEVITSIIEHANVLYAHVDSLTTKFQLEALPLIEVSGTYNADEINIK